MWTIILSVVALIGSIGVLIFTLYVRKQVKDNYKSVEESAKRIKESARKLDEMSKKILD